MIASQEVARGVHMNRYMQSLTVMGSVVERKPADRYFSIQCLSGDVFQAYITSETSFQVVQNLDGLNNDRVPDPPDSSVSADPAAKLIEKYVADGQLLVVSGIQHVNGQNTRFDTRTVYLLASVKDRYLFEETHWWITQTARL